MSGAESVSVVEVGYDDKYVVTECGTHDTEWGEVTHVKIGRTDERKIRGFMEVQSAKDEVFGKDRSAIEVYPKRDRLEPSMERHLWVLPEGEDPPFGIHDEDPTDASM